MLDLRPEGLRFGEGLVKLSMSVNLSSVTSTSSLGVYYFDEALQVRNSLKSVDCNTSCG
jgi:hypothetical protein